MSERPILFSGNMVRAILTGRKTQTRRAVKLNDSGRPALGGKSWHIDDPNCVKACPLGQPGDHLWVRERWAVDVSFDYLAPRMLPVRGMPVFYHANAQCFDYKWRPSIHMPRWASRITLEVTDVRVQLLQEISDEDAIAEGVEPNWCGTLCGWSPEKHGWRNYLEDQNGTESMRPETSFSTLWDSINAKIGLGWVTNPWVWAVSFKVVTP